MRFFILGIASLGGAGYFPWASGTVASALTIPVYFWLRPYPGWYTAVTLLCCVVGVWSAGAAERLLGEKDPHKVVINEMAGYLIAAAFLPFHWFYPVAAFFIFRALDVWKPFPARVSQQLPGGWGIMIDDIIVALYTNGLLQLARLVLPWQ